MGGVSHGIHICQQWNLSNYQVCECLMQWLFDFGISIANVHWLHWFSFPSSFQFYCRKLWNGLMTARRKRRIKCRLRAGTWGKRRLEWRGDEWEEKKREARRLVERRGEIQPPVPTVPHSLPLRHPFLISPWHSSNFILFIFVSLQNPRGSSEFPSLFSP